MVIFYLGQAQDEVVVVADRLSVKLTFETNTVASHMTWSLWLGLLGTAVVTHDCVGSNSANVVGLFADSALNCLSLTALWSCFSLKLSTF